MEFLKDYDFKLSYHPGKANVVADALSRKSLGISWMMIKEEEMISGFENLKLGMRETSKGIVMAQLQLTSDFKIAIQQAQAQNSGMLTLLTRMKQISRKRYAKIKREYGDIGTEFVYLLRST